MIQLSQLHMATGKTIEKLYGKTFVSKVMSLIFNTLSRFVIIFLLRYMDNTTRMAESKEELKSLLMRVKEESERASLKPSITKTKIMAYPAPLLYGKQKGKSGSSDRFAFLGL